MVKYMYIGKLYRLFYAGFRPVLIANLSDFLAQYIFKIHELLTKIRSAMHVGRKIVKGSHTYLHTPFK